MHLFYSIGYIYRIGKLTRHSISTGGAAMKAIRNTEVAVNKVAIIKTPCPVPLINGLKELRNIKCSASVVLWKLARTV